MDVSLIAVFAAIIFLLIGLSGLYIAKKLEIDLGNSSWVIIFSPIFAYLLLSGILTEFKVGDFEAKFRSEVEKSLPATLLNSTHLVGKDAADVIQVNQIYFGIAKRVLAIDLGEIEKMDTDFERYKIQRILAISIYQSILSGGFVGLVVLDENRKPLGFFEASYFNELLRIPLERTMHTDKKSKLVLTSEQIAARLEETQVWSLLKFSRKRAEIEGNKSWARFDISKGDAYRKMVSKNYSALVIVDQAGHYIGVISKERLFDSLFVDLIGLEQS